MWQRKISFADKTKDKGTDKGMAQDKAGNRISGAVWEMAHKAEHTRISPFR